LLALGLQRQLAGLAMTDIYEYLTLSHDPTTVGILLGMAVAKYGSCDAAISKMLCLHIPALLPQPFAEMEVSAVAQTAAIIGIGLLYCATAHRLMAEFLLGEIARRTNGDRMCDREAYTLSAGLALGLVTLGKGATIEAAGLGDLHIAQRLHRALTGGCEHQKAGIRSAFCCKTTEKGHGMRGSRVREGEYINTDVTAPGAILALGLYFLRTNSTAAAARLQLPDTSVLIDTVRPDLMLLRVVARALILWDYVRPSIDWVESQLPAVLQNYMRTLKASTSSKVEVSVKIGYDHYACSKQSALQSAVDWSTIRQTHANIIAGGCFAIGLRYAGTGCSMAAGTLRHFLMHFRALRGGDSAPVHEKVAYESKHIPNIGTAVLDCISAWRPDQPTLEICLGVISVSLGMVMAGTGDLGSLRILRHLRWRIDEDITYGTIQDYQPRALDTSFLCLGTHMAIHIAIGLLFVGSGRASLSRSKRAIAALLIAFFPRFPQNAGDNQYHLQPLRHLWVLATDWRGLKAVDVDTDADASVPLQVQLHASIDYVGKGVADSLVPSQSLWVMAPDLLPPFCDVTCVQVVSERYHPAALHISQNLQHVSSISQHLIYVKRRPGYLSYSQDPYALRGKMCETQESRSDTCTLGVLRVVATWARPSHPFAGKETGMSPVDVLTSYTTDPLLFAFAREFCDNTFNCQAVGPLAQFWGSGRFGSLLKGIVLPVDNWCARILYECVARDKPTAMPLYLQLYHAALTIHWKTSATQAWSLGVALEYSNSKLKELITNTCCNRDDDLVHDNFMNRLTVYIRTTSPDF
jgi:anaphase-promoting complex subunit 1